MERKVTVLDMQRKWRTLLLLSLAELLGMAVWFSASAVVPHLAKAWNLDESGQAWLTMSVQGGFVVGALMSAIFNWADRVPAARLFAGSAILAAIATALIPMYAQGLRPALTLRFLTGFLMAGVYPVGMKIMATWTKEDRGLGIGLLVGALTLGSAAPHLLNALGGVGAWQTVLYSAAGLAASGGVLGAIFVQEGPYKTAAPRFNWHYLGEILRQRDVVLANLGYLGHMWELYAMWTWMPVFLLASFRHVGVSPRWASVVAFVAIAAGGVGSLIAGLLADRLGRTTLAMTSLLISGTCCLLAGALYGGPPVRLIVLCVVWGFAVVADSAQFSACVSELCRPEFVGTALTLQTSLGFLLTLITIRIIPSLERWVGWNCAFAFLAIGPAIGIWAMNTLRRSPSSHRLAGGKG